MNSFDKKDNCGCDSHEHKHEHGHEHSSTKSMIFQFGISAVFFVAGLTVLFMDKDSLLFTLGKQAVTISLLCFVIAWVFAGYKVVLTSLKNILKGQIFDENFLMTVATIGAFIIGEFPEAAAVMLFYNLGELVQHSAVDKSRSSIIDLMDLRPEFACVLVDDKDGNKIEKKVSPAEVGIGGLLVVRAGEKIPLDGIIEEGTTELDTASMTGESLPRSAEKNDEVLAGFVNLTGKIIVRTTKKLEDTAASKMLELIEEAQNRKAKIERFITSFAKVYTPIVTIGAVLLSVLPPLFLHLFYSAPITGWASFAPWVSRGLVFLVISCPCAFVISVPLGYFGGIGGAAKRGILIKGADYIDALAKARGVVFDKTGTLTKGVLKVMALLPTQEGTNSAEVPNAKTSDSFFGSGISKETIKNSSEKYDILKFAFLAEQNSGHPIARAISECAAVNLPEADYKELLNAGLNNYSEQAGKGISVDYKGKHILVGKNSFLEEKLGRAIPATGDEIGGSQVFVAYDNRYLGCIILTDTLKDNAALAISNLKKLNISHIEMMTGDSQKAAEHTANELGIENYKALLLPHEKVGNFERISAQIKSGNKKGKVIFVGDGINDAPVLARSDAGIAMGGIGSDAAIEAADIVLMNDNPALVPKAIELSRFTRKIVRQNISFAFIIKLGFLSLGALGIANLWAAVFADVGVALLAVLNSLRARRF